MKYLAAAVLAAMATGCASSGATTSYENPDEMSSTAGVGVESQDIRAMTDRMARDILAAPVFAAKKEAPYVIVDDKYFVNEGSEPVNKRMITERLMVELNRAAAGRMLFVERQAEDMVQAERDRKRSGEVADGTVARSAKVAGADYRLTGRILTQDAIDAKAGSKTRYNQIVFKLVDLETSLAVWTGMYEFRKTSTSDVIYR